MSQSGLWGRPTDYRSEMGEQIIDAMATVLSLDAAAAEIGISPRSAYQWQADVPKFAQAIETTCDRNRPLFTKQERLRPSL